MGPEAFVLALAALVAGATGSWSPCGFSMIDTLGPTGHDRGRRLTVAACAAFALGAPAGGVLVFGGLAVAGHALQDGGGALGLAAAIALAAAVLDLLGLPVTPQIRRQVPEPWRRVLPLPLAGLLYGVLLGMGFTTFVLSYAVPALAAVSVALGDPRLGLVLGVAFGVGRALPIVALAPFAGSETGARMLTLMAERPALLRGARAGAGCALLACAAALAAPGAAAAPRVIRGATDPSANGSGGLAWQALGGGGRLRTGHRVQRLGAGHPALGGDWVAVVSSDGIEAINRDGRRVHVPVAADALAVGPRWLAWRAGTPAHLAVLDLSSPGATPRTVVRAHRAVALSRPALDGDLLAYASASRRGNAIRGLNLRTGHLWTLRRQRGALLDQPALRHGMLLYTRTTRLAQQLMLGRAVPRSAGGDGVLLTTASTTRHDAGHDPGYTTQGRRPEDARPSRPTRLVLWSTALTDVSAYVTRFDPLRHRASILRIAR